MKKKNFMQFLLIAFIVCLPLVFPCAKAQEDDSPVYTVTLKSGEGHGDDVIIKSTDESAEEEVGDYPNYYFYNDNGVTYYVASYPPPTFSSPTNKEYSFTSWENEGSFYHYGEAIAIPESTRSLVLTAQWDDSWFKLQTPKVVKITEPGYTTFTCTLADLHLGSYMEEYYSKDAENLTLRFQSGSLTNDDKTLSYLVRLPESSESNAEDFAETQKFTEEDKGKEFQISIYISPEDFENAKNGTYTGALKCTGIYRYRRTPILRAERSASTTTAKSFEGENIEIPLVLNLDPAETENAPLASQDIPKTGDQSNNVPIILAFSAMSLIVLALTILHKKQCNEK